MIENPKQVEDTFKFIRKLEGLLEIMETEGFPPEYGLTYEQKQASYSAIANLVETKSLEIRQYFNRLLDWLGQICHKSLPQLAYLVYSGGSTTVIYP